MGKVIDVQNIIQSLPSLTETVKQYGLLANKGHSKNLGQNFLLDYNITKKIVRLCGVLKNHTVLEIGPGPGGLTRAILEEQPNALHVVDLDETCIQVMKDLQKQIPFLIPHHQDALLFDFKAIAKNEKIFILSNLPYHIGTELLIHWLKNISYIYGMVLMFQKEVAERIVATPHTKAYGRLSIISQYFCDIEMGFHLPAKLFTPAPKVDSTVLKFTPKKDIDLLLLPFLEKVSALAFGQRRKMLRSSLKNIMNEDDFKACDIEPTKRAEELALQDFITISKYCKEKGKV